MSGVEFLPLFESKSQRVKGLAFHPTRPWLLASLHTGIIQLWDYRLRVLLERFTEHEGPVRSVDFHPTQSVFASGGDDFKVRVWALGGKGGAGRRPLAVLSGHVDYVRTVHFHPEQPWLLTASDDQTIRIWNWQSRQQVAVLSGHTHYVMSARWHATEDLIISASLDQTVRVWDYTALRKKAVLPSSSLSPSSPAAQALDEAHKLQNELFGTGDVTVKFVLEGHERGVNWASFHPSLPLAVSGSDDRTLKLWRMNESKAWEVDTLRAHTSNVSCALFHPKADLLITNGEDKTLRVWDLGKRQVVYTHRREQDRFWYLVAHPRQALFAAAHDGGLVVFKLQRERPAHALLAPSLLYAKDRFLRQHDLQGGRDQALFPLRPPKSGVAPREVLAAKDGAVLVTYTAQAEEGGGGGGVKYDLYALPKGPQQDLAPLCSGSALSVAWLRRQRFAVLVKSTLVHIVSPSGEVVKKVTPPYPCDALLAAPVDCLLLRSEDRLVLYDVQQERVLGELKVAHVKSAIWQEGNEGLVALLCRGALVLCTRRLERVLHIPETLRIKSGQWDELGTFLYTTLSHLKFCLPPPPKDKDKEEEDKVREGDHGIVRALDRAVYLVSANTGQAQVTILDRAGKVRQVPIDVTEYQFKRALALRRFDEVLRTLKSKALVGHALVGYLQRVGYPELALHFVQDAPTRFQLALEAQHAHNLDLALQAATTANEPAMWSRLGVESLRQGSLSVRQRSLQHSLDFERLSFQHFLTGARPALSLMLGIAREKRQDASAQLFNTLLLGDVEGRVHLLQQAGQYSLALLLARSHGLTALADPLLLKIQAEATRQGLPPTPLPPSPEGAKLMLPPVPLLRLEGAQLSWPHTRTTRGPFDALLQQASQAQGQAQGAQGQGETKRIKAAQEAAEEEGVETGAWDEGGLGSDEEKEEEEKEEKPKEAEEEGGWGDEEDALDEALREEAQATPTAPLLTLPPPGPPKSELWARSPLAAEQVAAGKFDVALKLLQEQIGLVSPAPLKPHFAAIYRARTALLPLAAGLPPLRSFLDLSSPPGPPAPRLPLSLASQVDLLASAYRSFTGGKFQESLEQFRLVLHSLPLLVVSSRPEAQEVKQLLLVCKEYVVGLLLELKRKEVVAGGGAEGRALELAALFTHVQLQPRHLQLVLKVAITAAVKGKCYALAEDLAHRLQECSPPPELQEHAEKALRLAEQKGGSDALKLNYDSRNPFVICAGSLTPIYSGSPSIQCPYCSASFVPQAKGRRCTVCLLSEIGRPATGLQSGPAQAPRRQ